MHTLLNALGRNLRVSATPASHKRQGTGLLRASGILLGAWGASYFLAIRPIHLDSDKVFSKRGHGPSQSLNGNTTITTTSLFTKEKDVAHFDINRALDIDRRLREHEQSIVPAPRSGISRYDVVQIASNNPSEDDHAEAILPVPSGYWSLFGVFDGHAGWETSAWLRENLLLAVSGALADLYSQFKASQSPVSSDSEPSPNDIERTIKDTFNRLDDDIVKSALEQVLASDSKYKAVNLLASAWAGSCALLSFYDSHSRLLHTAITGDSRAILGRRVQHLNGEVTYEVHLLSAEQDGHSPAEEARLNALHPGEKVVQNNRVLGFAISRAFGDARGKWGVDDQNLLREKYLGRTPNSQVRTPPYFTAEPEVTSIAIQPGDFLVMATDGLWECLTSKEVVGLVGLWRDDQSVKGESESVQRISPSELPIKFDEDDLRPTVRYHQWKAEKHFVNVDNNAATHLLRNALGGADTDLTAALLSMRSPRARTYMDDITTLVVFFDDK